MCEVQQPAVVIRWPGKFQAIALETNKLVCRIEGPVTGIQLQVKPQVRPDVKQVGANKVPEQAILGITLANRAELGMSAELGHQVIGIGSCR